MLPKLDDRNRTFWTGGADGQLHIAWCDTCRLWVQPPGADCPDCGGVLVDRPVSGRGSVFTYTVNYQPYMPGVPVPYVIAIVELEEQADLRIATNIVDCEPDSVYVGLPVRSALRTPRGRRRHRLLPGVRAAGLAAHEFANTAHADPRTASACDPRYRARSRRGASNIASAHRFSRFADGVSASVAGLGGLVVGWFGAAGCLAGVEVPWGEVGVVVSVRFR